jgi:hypothetical protein
MNDQIDPQGIVGGDELEAVRSICSTTRYNTTDLFVISGRNGLLPKVIARWFCSNIFPLSCASFATWDSSVASGQFQYPSHGDQPSFADIDRSESTGGTNQR